MVGVGLQFISNIYFVFGLIQVVAATVMILRKKREKLRRIGQNAG